MKVIAGNWAYSVAFPLTTTSLQLWKCWDLFLRHPSTLRKNIGGSRLVSLSGEHLETTIVQLINGKIASYEEALTAVHGISAPPVDFTVNSNMTGTRYFLRLLYHKNGTFAESDVEVITCDFTLNSLTCTHVVSSSECDFTLRYNGTDLTALYQSEKMRPFCDNLLGKMCRWAVSDLKPAMTSNQSVDPHVYLSTYSFLKSQYSKPLREIWETESTEPEKFIHEDIAIATYLSLLWKEPTSFVDLGCGNGLLVYLLNRLGHEGVGVDVRRRKIWDKFPDPVKLEAKTIDPRTFVTNAKWIIGNHSDELSPWIPVIAARSSYSTSFFLLPCCPYDFSGKKYQRQNAGVSQYSDYFEYLKGIVAKCGFQGVVDRLKIPSTKRLSIVGSVRMYGKEEQDVRQAKLASLYVDFVPRTEVETVRNCTKIGSDLIQGILDAVTQELVQGLHSEFEGPWRPIQDLVHVLTPDQLRGIRNECGGLQTLLRNHRFIFEVVKGRVRFRKPTESAAKTKKNWKAKPCWFYRNHPSSCPLPNDKCSYVHESD